jgi:ferric-dicitrate binding protein FerR (iron transport regulator)
MKRSRNENKNGNQGGADERAFAARLAELWQPRPLTGAGRAAFDAGLEGKLARRRRRRAALPALAAVTAAAAVVWVLLPASPADSPGHAAAVGSTAGWEYELIYDSADGPGSGESGSEMLPDDYRAIASVFLDG